MVAVRLGPVPFFLLLEAERLVLRLGPGSLAAAPVLSAASVATPAAATSSVSAVSKTKRSEHGELHVQKKSLYKMRV